MNKNIIILIAIFIIPLCAYFMFSHKSISNVSEAQINKPQVIKFTSTMCSECKRLEPVLQQVMPKYKGKIEYISIPVQVNNKYNEDMMAKYNITLVPTLIFLDKNQKVIKRVEGYIPAATLESYLRKICHD